jgi:hypothetical protein
MNNLEVLENPGTAAVKRLRKIDLEDGKPFMINSEELPARQSYMEYPDGTINVVSIAPDERSFTTIRQLSISEAQALRNRYGLQ